MVSSNYLFYFKESFVKVSGLKTGYIGKLVAGLIFASALFYICFTLMLVSMKAVSAHPRALYAVRGTVVTELTIYTVKKGDTLYSLCKKYKLTPQKFRRLNPGHSFTMVVNENVFINQKRVFATALKSIHVPTPKPVLRLRPQLRPRPRPRPKSMPVPVPVPVPRPRPRPKGVTSYICPGATVIKERYPPTRVLQSSKRPPLNQGRNFASSSLTDWFNRYGTARLDFATGSQFAPEAELLLPIYDKSQTIVFTQGGLHIENGHKQLNVGIGERYYFSSSMIGLNGFFDHDFSGQHSRLGAGVEYGRDYLKLVANSYVRLSGWKPDKALPANTARPANGWDLRAIAYLPALPALGAELDLEHYISNQSDRPNSDKLRNALLDFTLGVNYTPVPLISFNAAYKRAQASQAQMRFGVAFNYKVGQRWEEQWTTASVDNMRRLSNSRYDLVERNNNIVLESGKSASFTFSVDTANIKIDANKIASVKVTLASASGLKIKDIDFHAKSEEYKKDHGVIRTYPVEDNGWLVKLKPPQTAVGRAGRAYIVTLTGKAKASGYMFQSSFTFNRKQSNLMAK